MSDKTSDSKPSGSLESRITSPPLDAKSSTFKPSAATPGFTPAVSTVAPTTSTSWADEVASPIAEISNGLEKAQMDGAGEPLNGSELTEPNGSFEVAVQLSDLQANPNDPLYSVKRFEDLGL
jgi:hypothetical protein